MLLECCKKIIFQHIMIQTSSRNTWRQWTHHWRWTFGLGPQVILCQNPSEPIGRLFDLWFTASTLQPVGGAGWTPVKPVSFTPAAAASETHINRTDTHTHTHSAAHVLKCHPWPPHRGETTWPPPAREKTTEQLNVFILIKIIWQIKFWLKLKWNLVEQL